MDKFRAEISWFTPPVGPGVGYGYAAVETITALNQKGIVVNWKVEYPKVQISFVQPDFYEGNNSQWRVGYTPWESSQIPIHWVEKMQTRDEIWTPTSYCKEVFEHYKVNDIIRVVPHGIDPEIWKIENRFLRDKFVFFHVGGPTARKGGQRVVDAFLDLYEGNLDYILVMKSNEVSEARCISPMGTFGNVSAHPQILVIPDVLDIYDLVKLYNKAHCMVYPTNGEGFGLIPFQAIASGLPTICTNATGCKDFAELSVPLDSKPTQGVGIHLGSWVEPNKDDLRDKMKYVADNYDEVKEKTLHSARVIHNTQTWGHVAQQIIDLSGDKIYERV